MWLRKRRGGLNARVQFKVVTERESSVERVGWREFVQVHLEPTTHALACLPQKPKLPPPSSIQKEHPTHACPASCIAHTFQKKPNPHQALHPHRLHQQITRLDARPVVPSHLSPLLKASPKLWSRLHLIPNHYGHTQRPAYFFSSSAQGLQHHHSTGGLSPSGREQH